MDFLEMDLDLFLLLEDLFAAKLPLEALFLRIITFFLAPAETDIFRDLDLTGSRFLFTMIDGMRALDLNPETFIFLPVNVAFLDFLFLLAVDLFLMSNSTSLLTSRCILLVLDLTISEL